MSTQPPVTTAHGTETPTRAKSQVHGIPSLSSTSDRLSLHDSHTILSATRVFLVSLFLYTILSANAIFLVFAKLKEHEHPAPGDYCIRYRNAHTFEVSNPWDTITKLKEHDTKSLYPRLTKPIACSRPSSTKTVPNTRPISHLHHDNFDSKVGSDVIANTIANLKGHAHPAPRDY